MFFYLLSFYHCRQWSMLVDSREKVLCRQYCTVDSSTVDTSPSKLSMFKCIKKEWRVACANCDMLFSLCVTPDMGIHISFIRRIETTITAKLTHTPLNVLFVLATENADLLPNLSLGWKNKMPAFLCKETGEQIQYGISIVNLTFLYRSHHLQMAAILYRLVRFGWQVCKWHRRTDNLYEFKRQIQDYIQHCLSNWLYIS